MDLTKIEKAFVTGVTGFIGGAYARHLVAAGVKVSGLVRPGREGFVPSGVEPILGDLSKVDQLKGVTRGASHVFHSGALLNEPPPGDKEREKYHEKVNVESTRALAMDALESKVQRFVQISTLGVYGDSNFTTISEETPVSPDTVYHRTKYESDVLLLELLRTKGLPVVFLRPPLTVGPGNLTTHLLKIARFVGRGHFPTFGSALTQRVPMVALSDFIQALNLAALTAPVGEIYLVSSGQEYTFGQVLDLMARFAGRKRGTIYCPEWLADLTAVACEAVSGVIGISAPLTRHKLRVFRQDRVMNIQKIVSQLHYDPKCKRLEEVLLPALEDYRARGLLPGAS